MVAVKVGERHDVDVRRIDARGTRSTLIPGVAISAAALWAMGLFSETTPLRQVILTHIVLSFGLACTFTPLFSVSLGSLPPKLMSHGSATISTAQQVAGAAGTALFVTVMTLVSVRAAGSPEAVGPEALAAGTRAAFLLGGVASTLAIAAAWFIRDPEPRPIGAAAQGSG